MATKNPKEEKTLVLIKPDGVKRGLIGEVVARIEKRGLKEMGTDDPMKIGKSVRNWILDFMTSGPVVKIVVEGIHAVDMVRKLVGNSIPALAEMGTIRGDFSVDSAALANK